jgi:uncharacterized protein (DUF433 family)
MMTPQEKAKKLISINSLTILSKVGNKLTMDQVKEIAKQFTLLEIDEVINALDFNQWQNAKQIEYYQEVNQEIEKL